MEQEKSMRESANAASAAPASVNNTSTGFAAGAPVLRRDVSERLKGAIPPPPAVARPVLRIAPTNRRNLLITSLPLALFALFCLSAVVSRAAGPRLGRQTFGKTSRIEATTIARSALHELTGETAEAVEVTTQTAYSYRRGETVREWNVLFDTQAGRYLMRLNADTGTVYAVNRLNGENPPADEVSGVPSVSRQEAEVRARAYLGLLGVPTRELTLVPEANLLPDPGHPARKRIGGDLSPEEFTGLYNFTYRRPVPGLGSRLLKVSVRRQNAALEHIWNPVSAM